MNWLLTVSCLFLATACVRSSTQCPEPATAAALPNTPCQHDATTFRCVKYLHNYDADTVTVRIPDVHPLFGEAISVRVRGIDSAEIKGKTACESDVATQARDIVTEILTNAKTIELTDIGRDKYFRVLATVRADGVSIADTLKQRNLAVSYDGGTKSRINWCDFSKGNGKSKAR